MRTAALALLILLHPGLPAAQEDQQEQATALLSRAAELSNIRKPGSAPFFLRAQVRLLKLAAGEQEGTYTLLWESPDRWRAQIDFGGYRDVQAVTERRQWHHNPANHEPLRVFEARQVMEFASRLELREQETVGRVRFVDEGASPTHCIEMEGLLPGTELMVERELCFDAATGHLVSEKRSHLTNIYTDYAPWGSGLFPRALRVFEGEALVVEVIVSEPAALPAIDPAWFALPTGTEWLVEPDSGTGSDISEPERLLYVSPEYPEQTRRRGSEGSVVIQGFITSAGKVAFTRFAKALPDNALNESAMVAVGQWEYAPTLIDGQPVSVPLTVVVVFQLVQ